MRYFLWVAFSMFLISCQTTDELKFDDGKDKSKHHLKWQDILSQKKHRLKPSPHTYINHVNHNGYVRSASKQVKNQPHLGKLAANHFITRAVPLDVGVYGKSGDLSKFVALRSDIPDRNRLYRAQVQSLSEKYGCFIRGRWKKKHIVGFKCRDRRTVVQWIFGTSDYIGFISKQYDEKGRAIVVENHEIVNTSPKSHDLKNISYKESDFLNR